MKNGCYISESSDSLEIVMATFKIMELTLLGMRQLCPYIDPAGLLFAFHGNNLCGWFGYARQWD